VGKLFLDEIYGVDRKTYSNFVYRLTGGFGRIETEETDEYIITAMVSKRTDKIWCARKTWKNGNKEQYYIVDYPDKDEWSEPIGIRKIELTTREQVEALFRALQKEE
jgi:hypothetical protein